MDATESWPEGSRWGLSGYVRSAVDGQPVQQATVTVSSVDPSVGVSSQLLTDAEGFFHAEVAAADRAVELQVTVTKEGWARSRVQSLWLEGRALLEVEQSPGKGLPPKIEVSHLSPYQVLSGDGEEVVVRATGSAPMEQLSVGVLGKGVLMQVKGSSLTYALAGDDLPQQQLTLVFRAVDEEGNRSEVYLPLRRLVRNGFEVVAPARSYDTAVEAQAMTVASSQQPGEALFAWVDFVIPRPGSGVRAVRVARGQNGAFREIAYVTKRVSWDFVYRDASPLLQPGQSYQYRFAYDGDGYSEWGEVVPVQVLPVYAVELTEPFSGEVLSRGSNVLFRWRYILGPGELPAGTVRSEHLVVYAEADWGNSAAYTTLPEPLSSPANGLSLPLSHFPLGLKQLWNVASELSVHRASSSDQSYWTSGARSLPSSTKGSAGNGYFSFIREVLT